MSRGSTRIGPPTRGSAATVPAALPMGGVGALLGLAGATGGGFLAGMLDALLPGGRLGPTQAVIAVSVAVATAAVTTVVASRLLAGASAGAAARGGAPALALVVGASVAGVPVALSATEPRLASVVAWMVLLGGGAAAGAALALRRTPPSGDGPGPRSGGGRGRRGPGPGWRGEEGALAAENVAVVVLVGTLVAALVALSLPTAVGDWGRYAVCTLFDDDCERPGAHTVAEAPAEDWTPDGCTRASREVFVDLGAGITWVDLGTRQGYTVLAMDDGTYQVTYTGSGSAGASKSGGAWLEIHGGEESFSTGAHASAGASLRFEDGLSWAFDSEQDAREWVEWHVRDGFVPEMLDNPVTRFAGPGPAGGLLFAGGRDSPFGQVWGAGNRAINWLGERVGLVDEPPPTPEVAERFVAGGVELDAHAELGYLFAGDTGVSLESMTQLGTSVRSDGEQVVYLEIETEMLASAGINLGPEARAGYADHSLVSVTLDDEGRPTQVDLQVHRSGDAGRDLTDVDEPRELLAGSWSADASGEPLRPSLYQIDATLDLDPDHYDDLGDVLAELAGASGAAVPGRPGDVGDRLFDEGRVSVVEYTDLERNYGGALGGAVSAEISGSLVVGDRSLDAVGAHYFDRNSDAFVTWLDCAG